MSISGDYSSRDTWARYIDLDQKLKAIKGSPLDISSSLNVCSNEFWDLRNPYLYSTTAGGCGVLIGAGCLGPVGGIMASKANGLIGLTCGTIVAMIFGGILGGLCCTIPIVCPTAEAIRNKISIQRRTLKQYLPNKTVPTHLIVNILEGMPIGYQRFIISGLSHQQLRKIAETLPEKEKRLAQRINEYLEEVGLLAQSEEGCFITEEMQIQDDNAILDTLYLNYKDKAQRANLVKKIQYIYLNKTIIESYFLNKIKNDSIKDERELKQIGDFAADEDFQTLQTKCLATLHFH